MKNSRQAQPHKEVDPKELCPCESGLSYSACCKKRKLRWNRDKAGKLYKQIKLSSEAVASLKEAEAQFKEVFGRKPRKHDPVFLTKYLNSEADVKRVTLQAMRQANIRPELIYVYIKTGRLVADMSRLSTSEANEYTDAIDEFLGQVGEGVPVENLIETDMPEKYLRATLQHAQIIGGYYVDMYMNSGFARRHAKHDMNAEFVVSFAFVSFIKCLRTIYALLAEGISYDASYLVRALYENYLKIRYVYHAPSYADEIIKQFTADLKLVNNGKDEESKKLYKNYFRWEMMARELDEVELYDKMYRPLCSMTHAQLYQAQYFITDLGFDYLEQDFEMSTLLTALELIMRTFHCVLKHSKCQKYLKRDLSTAIRQAFSSIHVGWMWVTIGSDHVMPKLTRQYMESLAAEDPRLKRVLEVQVIDIDA